jgi:hypothetical protein
MKKLLLLVSLLFTMSAGAIPLTALLNGGSITVGDKLFDNWEVLREESSDFGFFGVDTDSIDVTGLPDGGLEPGPGLHFEILNDALSIEGDGIYAFLDFMFGFRVSVLDPLLKIKDNSLYLTDYELLNPTTLTSVFIEEKIYADANRGNEIGTKDVEGSDVFGFQTEKLFDSADFAPSDEIWVTKNILLEAIDFGESASLYSFEQRFSQVEVQVPEPSVLILFSLGLFAVAMKRKRA